MGSNFSTIDGLSGVVATPEQMRKTIEAGIIAMNLTAWRVQVRLPDALLQLQAKLDAIEAMPDLVLLVKGVSDIRTAQETGRCAIILGAQNSVMVEDDVKLLKVFHTLGLRIVQPTYNEPNAFGYGAASLHSEDKGITEDGRAWVSEMKRNKMIIDLSHCGHKTSADYIAEAKCPVVFSHSNSTTLCPSPRNKPDDLLRAVSKTGGLTGMVTFEPFISLTHKPTVEDILDHFDHLVNVCGIDHVAWGSDLPDGNPAFENIEYWEEYLGPKGRYPSIMGIAGDWYTFENRLMDDFHTISQTPVLWDGLSRRGYSHDQIDKIASGNWMRVMREVWGE